MWAHMIPVILFNLHKFNFSWKTFVMGLDLCDKGKYVPNANSCLGATNETK